MPNDPSVLTLRGLKVRIYRWITRHHVRVYRLSGGLVGGKVGDAPVMLLDHKGRKTGTIRTVPVCFVREGEDLVILASHAGSERDPAWWGNLKANPETTVTIRRRRRRVVASEIPAGEEYDRLWERAAAAYEGFHMYRARTDRHIPMVRLRPVG